MTEQTMEKPMDRLTIMVNKAETELFMSAGLVRRLAARTMGEQAISGLYFDVPLQNALMLEALAPRTPRGEVKKEYDLDDFEMTIDDGQTLIGWISKHLLYFFVQSANRMKDDLQGPEALLQTLTGSSTGTPNSQDKSVSAGPSTAA